MAAIEPGFLRAASAMASPRSRTSATASSTFMAPAAASAANSPTEWPTTKSGLMPRALIAARTARLVATSAGCCTSVSTNSISGASKQRYSRSRPAASLARSKISLASGTAFAISRPMPLSSDPWPGKQNATSPPFTASTPSGPSPR